MKKVTTALIGSVLAMSVSGSVLAETVFYCQSDDTVAEVTKTDNVFNYKVTVKGKKKPIYNITKKHEQLGAYVNAGDGHNFSVTIVLLDGDFSYQMANDKYKDANYGSFEVLRMGTSIAFGKCQPDTYVQKITSKEIMNDITIID